MKTKELIVEITKVGKNCYIVTEMFRGKCLRVYTHLGNLKNLKNCIMIDYRIQE